MRRHRLGWVVGWFALLTPACGESGSADGSGSTGPVEIDCEVATATLAGHLVVESEADLAELVGVRAVEGELQIDKTDFTTLDALRCIEEVGDELTIFGNAALTDTSGLSALRRVGGGLIISENDALPELAGIDALTEVGGSVIIQDNAAMTGITGLSGLDTIEGAINIRSNDALVHIDGLGRLRTVGGQLAITQNPNLCISSVNRVGAGITDPVEIPDNWSTRSNDDDC